MKYLNLFLIIVFFSQLGFSQSNLIKQTDYELLMPENWKSIPENIIAKFDKGKDVNSENYLIGFAKTDVTLKTTPFFLCDYYLLEGEKENVSFREVIEAQMSLLKGRKTSEPQGIDSENFKFYVEVELNNTKLLSSYSLDDRGILHLQFFSNTEDYEKNKTIFLNVHNSIKHYVPFKEQKGSFIGKSNIVTSLLIIAIIILVLLIGINFYRRRKK